MSTTPFPSCLIFGVSALIASTALADQPISYRNDVQPILTKYGCNQGACHGATAGKGGLALSLRGFDETSDYFQVVKAERGRRVQLNAPEQSLMLTKPTLGVAHKGGKRFEVGSAPYRVIEQWIKQGAVEPKPTDRMLAELKIEPAEIVCEPKKKFTITVTAKYNDGTQELVEQKAQFDSLNGGIASVTSTGNVETKLRGETGVLVRFVDKVSVCRIIVPYRQLPADQKIDASIAQAKQPIDKILLSKWKKLGITPSSACSDHEFVRRVHLDILGTLPTVDRVKSFLADKSADKRVKLIDEVLARPEYVDFWTYKWGDLLRNNRELVGEKGMWTFHEWMRDAFRRNLPMDQFAQQMITAVGSLSENGPANVYRVGRQPLDWAENTAQVFLGVRVQCARCHHHPLENISQADYYALGAVFARLGTKQSQEFGIYGTDTVVFTREDGEMRHPRTGQIVKPSCLGTPLADDPIDRRRQLAALFASKDYRAFSRNIVNRYWGYLLGRGIIDPVDDIRSTNLSACDELLDHLTSEFIKSGFDLKSLIRMIANSQAYQRSSEACELNEIDGDNVYFTRYTAKRLTAEQLLDAIDQVCGSRETFANLPADTRAISLPDSRVASRFMDAFGRPRREISCECERTGNPNMVQALQLMTGGVVHRKVSDPNGRIAQAIKKKTDPKQVIDEIYLATVSRLPTSAEKQAIFSMLSQVPPREGLEDVLWALVNSREFQFNH